MKHLLNTLYVTTHGAYLCHEGQSVLVKVDKEIKLRLPIHTLCGIVCFGQVSCSPPLLGLCGESGVHVSFLTEYGRFLARVQGPISGNVRLRREQYRRADRTEGEAKIARAMVLAKIANSRTVMQRALRDHPESQGHADIESAVSRMAAVLDDLRTNDLNLESIRAREGEAAKIYFYAFDHLIMAQKDDFFFRARSRRPPLDNINALLSFIYTLLVHDAESALEAIGLDPQVGFLHADRPGRPGLALDLMEEFRSFLADRLALSLVNMRQIQAKGFRASESGGVEMDGSTRKEVLVAYQKRKQEEIQHPFLGETIKIGLLPHVQSLLLARHLRGDLDGYPPFIWK